MASIGASGGKRITLATTLCSSGTSSTQAGLTLHFLPRYNMLPFLSDVHTNSSLQDIIQFCVFHKGCHSCFTISKDHLLSRILFLCGYHQHMQLSLSIRAVLSAIAHHFSQGTCFWHVACSSQTEDFDINPTLLNHWWYTHCKEPVNTFQGSYKDLPRLL